jgi:hypothetical protein
MPVRITKHDERAFLHYFTTTRKKVKFHSQICNYVVAEQTNEMLLSASTVFQEEVNLKRKQKRKRHRRRSLNLGTKRN